VTPQTRTRTIPPALSGLLARATGLAPSSGPHRKRGDRTPRPPLPTSPLRRGRRDKRERRRSGWGYFGLGEKHSKSTSVRKLTPTPDPSPQGGGEKLRASIKTTPYPKSSPLFLPTFRPHAILRPLPLPDGSRTCWTRREEGLSGSAVTCGRSRKEAEAIGVPLAGGRVRPCKASHRAGTRFHNATVASGNGNIRSGPVADMTSPVRRVRVRAGTSRTTPAVCPDRGRSNPGGCNIPRGARRRLSDADIIRRYSGRARGAPPIPPIPEAKPACGPPDLTVIETRRPIQPRGFWRGVRARHAAKPPFSPNSRIGPCL
jgi:hypothetical protein